MSVVWWAEFIVKGNSQVHEALHHFNWLTADRAVAVGGTGFIAGFTKKFKSDVATILFCPYWCVSSLLVNNGVSFRYWNSVNSAPVLFSSLSVVGVVHTENSLLSEIIFTLCYFLRLTCGIPLIYFYQPCLCFSCTDTQCWRWCSIHINIHFGTL